MKHFTETMRVVRTKTDTEIRLYNIGQETVQKILSKSVLYTSSACMKLVKRQLIY